MQLRCPPLEEERGPRGYPRPWHRCVVPDGARAGSRSLTNWVTHALHVVVMPL
jgi:hypothetical protein